MLNVVAVVVTYHPQFEVLHSLIEALQGQVSAVVIVDNTSGPEVAAWESFENSRNSTLIRLARNHGIGYAQNIGIHHAVQLNATHILLMDQDSLPAADMVEKLLMAAQKYENVASVGPSYSDLRNIKKSSFIRLHGIWLRRWNIQHPQAVIPVDFLISSGSLLPVAVIDKVGLLREDLFIDYVDIEWCLRAKREGLQCYGVHDAKMMHCIGERPIEFFGVKFSVHKPLRLYYQFRNAVLLCKESWLPARWKCAIALNIFMKFGFYLLPSESRKIRMRMMLRGCLHGWNGWSGRAGEHKT